MLYAKCIKYLLLDLEPGTSQADLEGLVPDFPAMQAASTNNELVGVIVATQSGAAISEAFVADISAMSPQKLSVVVI